MLSSPAANRLARSPRRWMQFPYIRMLFPPSSLFRFISSARSSRLFPCSVRSHLSRGSPPVWVMQWMPRPLRSSALSRSPSISRCTQMSSPARFVTVPGNDIPLSLRFSFRGTMQYSVH